MKDWLNKYWVYIIIALISLRMVLVREYGMGLGLGTGLSLGYYHFVDKKILKH